MCGDVKYLGIADVLEVGLRGLVKGKTINLPLFFLQQVVEQVHLLLGSWQHWDVAFRESKSCCDRSFARC
ncbi:hypothetical protein D3C83_238680 [compost metagenome]